MVSTIVAQNFGQSYWLSKKSVGVCLLSLFLAASCGPREEERFPELESASPLTLERGQVGVGLHHGDALGAAVNRNGAALVDGANFFGHAFFHVRSYDEVSGIVGEYHVQRVREEQIGEAVRGPTDFPIRSPAARLSNRGADLSLELEKALEIANATGFDDRSFVVDFWRTRGDWLIRWDGNLNSGSNIEGKGTYGFDREDMVIDLISQFVDLANQQQPTWLVVGDSMDRFLAAAGYEDGLGPEQFQYFLEFFQQVVPAVHAVSPETKVVAGFHWENVAGPLAAAYHGVDEAALTEELLDEVFEVILLPFAEAGDGIGLRIRAVRGEMEDWKYQFLRRLDGLYNQSIPVVIYSVSTPIQSQAEYPQQRLFLERFSEVMAGVNPEVVAWERFTNIDGVDTGDQSVVGRCAALSNPNTRLQMPQERCYDGLLTLFQDKPAFTALRNLVSSQE